MPTMECYNCGAEIPADAPVCPRCGIRFAPKPDASTTDDPDRCCYWPTWAWGALAIGVVIILILLWGVFR
ncbi:MAG: hypothetical protein GXP39_13115 [Chloroflexi bacterium]|nr:hypothetical protein [Chloroflexota bacterium]